MDMYRSSMNGLRLVLGGMKIVLVNGRFLLFVAQLMFSVLVLWPTRQHPS